MATDNGLELPPLTSLSLNPRSSYLSLIRQHFDVDCNSQRRCVDWPALCRHVCRARAAAAAGHQWRCRMVVITHCGDDLAIRAHVLLSSAPWEGAPVVRPGIALDDLLAVLAPPARGH